ncbi:MAG: class I fructose-bisphosphate aldolase family protein [Deltaproteobacteria bacterium]|nr:class I fructose-bisphosphate aldolase family protein [Deltaproteobacteria bacterium]
MDNIGKMIRIERIIDRNSGKTVIIPMDHGISIGPVEGLIDWKSTINAVAEGGANAVVIHKGLVKSGHRQSGKDVGLIIHMSASTSLALDPNYKVMVCTIEEALRLGADAVSIHINIGAETEPMMLADFGAVAREARISGVPLLAMMYTRGPKIKNPYDTGMVKHAARVGAELGADIVKVPYTGSPETFRTVVEGCFVPVVIAGGEKMDTDRDILTMVKGSIDAGGAGVSIGRNVFQHRNPTKIVSVISNIVHDGMGVEEALKILEG